MPGPNDILIAFENAMNWGVSVAVWFTAISLAISLLVFLFSRSQG